MTTIRFHLDSGLPPEAVLTALTDFSERRSQVWPNIDAAHYSLHDQGPNWADVTEGSSVAGGVWERNRYEWDPAGGEVVVRTLSSNTWGPGSGWRYRLAPGSGGGTSIDVEAVRNGTGLKGRLLELVLSLTGMRRLSGDMEKVLGGLDRTQG